MVYLEKFIAVVVCNNDILRETNNDNIHLPFNSEYSIRFKNKESKRAVVSVEIDGEDVLSGYQIIIPGGETTNLEGFMDSSGKITNKFKFIKKTEKIAKHRGDRIDDGIITIKFQYEKPYSTGPYYSNNILRRRCIDEIPPLWLLTSYDSGSEINCSSLNNDEGVTVKGSESNQKFNTTYINTLEEQVYTICFKLHGTKLQGAKIKSALSVRTKLQCSTCGHKVRSSVRYCPECGTALF